MSMDLHNKAWEVDESPLLLQRVLAAANSITIREFFSQRNVYLLCILPVLMTGGINFGLIDALDHNYEYLLLIDSKNLFAMTVFGDCFVSAFLTTLLVTVSLSGVVKACIAREKLKLIRDERLQTSWLRFLYPLTLPNMWIRAIAGGCLSLVWFYVPLVLALTGLCFGNVLHGGNSLSTCQIAVYNDFFFLKCSWACVQAAIISLLTIMAASSHERYDK